MRCLLATILTLLFVTMSWGLPHGVYYYGHGGSVGYLGGLHGAAYGPAPVPARRGHSGPAGNTNRGGVGNVGSFASGL